MKHFAQKNDILLLLLSFSATPADSLSNSKTTLSPDHMMMADLNGQISHLQSLLETERKRKEACQKEIARLSKELVTAVGDGRKKQTSSGAPRRPKSLGIMLFVKVIDSIVKFILF